MNKLSKMYLGASLATVGFMQSAVGGAFAGSAITVDLPDRGFAQNLGQVISGVLSFVMVIAALLVLGYLIMGGIEWITSGGDKGKTESARNKITAAVIGIIILAASFAILNLVLNFLGFSDLDQALRFTTIRGTQVQ